MTKDENFLRKVRGLGKAINTLSVLSPKLAGKMAFRVFSTPKRIPLRGGDLAFFAQGNTHKIQVKKHHLAVYEWRPENWSASTGKTVLLLHGWDSSSARWRKLTKVLLREGYRVLAMDAPGSGQSSGNRLNLGLFSRSIQRIEQEFGLPYARIGHSLGGAAAVMSTALYGAGKPEKMVLMGVFAESTRVIKGFAQMMALEAALLPYVDQEVVRKTGNNLAELSVLKHVRELHDVKAMVVHDRADVVAPFEEGRQVAEAWGARYLETEGYGHSLQHKSVNEQILDFLNQA